MRRSSYDATILMFLALLSAGLVLTCKNSADLTGAPLNVTADFIPKPVTPGVTDRYVTLEKGVVNGNRITLDVVVHNVSEPISGIALKLKYPYKFSEFEVCTDGDLLPTPPGKCYFAEPSPRSGEVFIGRTITAPQQPVPVTGSKVIVRVHFLLFGVSADDIIIEGQNLGGGDASALLDANGNPILVTWFAGSLVGT